MGTISIGIVGQKAENVQKFLKKHGLPMPMLIDPDRAVIKRYGVYNRIWFDGFNVARPATFLIDRQGIIRFIYVGSNQLDRPSPEMILSELKR